MDSRLINETNSSLRSKWRPIVQRLSSILMATSIFLLAESIGWRFNWMDATLPMLRRLLRTHKGVPTFKIPSNTLTLTMTGFRDVIMLCICNLHGKTAMSLYSSRFFWFSLSQCKLYLLTNSETLSSLIIFILAPASANSWASLWSLRRRLKLQQTSRRIFAWWKPWSHRF